MKRFALLLMVLMLALSLTPVSHAESVRLVPEGETATLTVFRPMDANLQDYITNYNEAPFYQKLEEVTGVHIEFTNPTSSAAQESLNMLLLSGNMPDIIIDADNLYTGGSYQGVVDGYFIDLMPYLKEYAPEYWSIITSDDAIYREAANGDAVSCFARIYTEANPAWNRLVLKKETLDSLGVETVPVTIADWEALFDQMLAAGITPYMLNKTGYEEKLMGAYNVRADFYQEDGVVKYGQIQEGFRQYLELIHSWYEKGYISKDFISQSNVDTMFATGEIGTYDKPIVAAYNFGVSEGYTVLSTPYPRLTPDQFLHWDSYKASVVSRSLTYSTSAITASCKDVPLAVRWLNFLYTPEGMELANWGIRGENFDTVDGKNQYLPVMWDYNGISQEGLNYYWKSHNASTYSYNDTACHANLLKSPEATAIRLEYDDDPLLDSAIYLPNVSLNEEEATTRASIMNDIDTYVDEMVLKFIVGTEPLSNWDSYVANVQSMRLDDAIAAVQAAYDRYMDIKAPKE